ncbi:uncharacterized protein [Diabrotica undecimpunctata]|uniref:uncharacterized protein n=1 Tax=Diabrotica undecimpunctata TaxID=50387 RepID=UPI003B63AD74
MQYGIPVATLNRRIKSGKNEEEASRKKLGRFQTVFSPEQEKALVDHLIGMDKLFFGLSYLELRSLAFQYAEINKISNNFHKQNCLAGKDWLYLFLKRHPQLTLRTPENTSAARASCFNKVSVDTFFTLLPELQNKYAFSASRTYSCDETGITTVPNKPTKIISVKGKKQVGNLTSGERGTLITAESCISASGHYVPPFLIIPRQRKNPIYEINLPQGSIVTFHKSGWMRTEIMSNIWFPHFPKHTHPTENNPVLRILDGHSRHVKNLALIETARQHHVHILVIPPHTSHKFQPLDVSFMYPLSNYYTQEVINWQRNKSNKLIELQDVGQIFGKAYARAATLSNAENGFKSAGIVPYENTKFSDIDFAYF